MRISVVIPTYNRSELLVRTLASVFAQRRPADEIIVVDDGSTDDTRSVMSAYGDAAVRYLYQENAYLGAARNTGMRAATGDALLFLDSDDLLLPEALARLEQTLGDAPDAAFAYGGVRLIDGEDRDLSGEQAADHGGADGEAPDAHGEVWERLVESNFIRTAGCVLIRRTALEAAGEWSTTVRGNEDWDMWLRLAEHSAVARCEEGVLKYRVHPASMSSNELRMMSTALLMFEQHRDRLAADPGGRGRILSARVRDLRDAVVWRTLEQARRGALAGGARQRREQVVFALRRATPALLLQFARVRIGAMRSRSGREQAGVEVG